MDDQFGESSTMVLQDNFCYDGLAADAQIHIRLGLGGDDSENLALAIRGCFFFPRDTSVDFVGCCGAALACEYSDSAVCSVTR